MESHLSHLACRESGAFYPSEIISRSLTLPMPNEREENKQVFAGAGLAPVFTRRLQGLLPTRYPIK